MEESLCRQLSRWNVGLRRDIQCIFEDGVGYILGEWLLGLIFGQFGIFFIFLCRAIMPSMHVSCSLRSAGPTGQDVYEHEVDITRVDMIVPLCVPDVVRTVSGIRW
jgi:hypothetical protein